MHLAHSVCTHPPTVGRVARAIPIPPAMTSRTAPIVYQTRFIGITSRVKLERMVIRTSQAMECDKDWFSDIKFCKGSDLAGEGCATIEVVESKL